ncbi:hypothetical protein BDK51DRAFT_34964 [Blyttiomyces helicus]|uniref:DNA 5'-3' helicase n=1 Tax=Blyttiomyces helicus TaxID=388810 RepID=A0A4P9WCU4_9FUNG|nr:hypothetical protein BDK51DRAFT_34964 [Blyttiomyces helicus]|eukprot:RKO90499.1 hypothetical protein BDK51DRAFT_34964 [Blyttiomyces helicus]
MEPPPITPLVALAPPPAGPQQYTIRGVTVKFPYVAYDCQLALMDKVLESLQGIHLAGMGSGVLKDGVGAELLTKLDEAIAGVGKKETFDLDPPRIYYASRTHSQLSQAVSELRNTEYRPKICVLGSREQMCLNPDVLRAPNSARNSLCRQKVTKKGCEFHGRLENARAERLFDDTILDIEDLVKFGQAHRACPYYLSRDNQPKADVIFLPYNYLIDPATRRAQNIDVKNGILIFDEGITPCHNSPQDITLYVLKQRTSKDSYSDLPRSLTDDPDMLLTKEGSCGDTTSFDLTSSDIEACIREAGECAQLASDPLFVNRNVPADHYAILENVVRGLSEAISAIKLSSSGDLIKPGDFLYELLATVKITSHNVDLLLCVIESAIDLIAEACQNQRRTSRMALGVLQSALKIAFGGTGHEAGAPLGNSYKVYICQEAPSSKRLSSRDGPFKAQSGRTLSFWCFSSGIAMRSLVEPGVRSVILASGTLSPLESFATEMGIPFPIRLENPHVISPSQVFVGVIPRGPTDEPLRSTYDNRGSKKYMADLGNTVVNFARIVPDGMLVFFPSYGAMSACLSIWKLSENGKSVWDRIMQYKEPVLEPRGKQEFNNAIELFYKKLQDPTLTGAIFFAVCRGKASEGLDFSDTRGRAVIISGIPYPAIWVSWTSTDLFVVNLDCQVKLKKQYLDGRRETLSGNEWYQQQAARAVNQAIGRVFALPHNKSQLPLWVRPHVQEFKSFGEAQMKLTKFFKRMAAEPPAPIPAETENPRGRLDTSGTGHAAILQHPIFQTTASTKPAGHAVIRSRRMREGARDDGLELHAFGHESIKSENQVPNGPSRHVTSMAMAAKISYPTIGPTLPGPPSLSASSSNAIAPAAGPNVPGSDRRKRPSAEGTEDGAGAAEARKPKRPSDGGGASVKETERPATLFVDKVKRALPLVSYKRFQSALREFKANTLTMSALVEELVVIFTPGEGSGLDVQTAHTLMHGFRNFVPSRHRREYDESLLRFGVLVSGRRDSGKIYLGLTSNTVRAEKHGAGIGQDVSEER